MMRLALALFAVSRRFIGTAAATVSVAALAASPELTIVIGERTVRHSVEALLANPATTTITIPQDVAYKRAMTYRALPLATLLQGVGREDSVKFVASDGFAATIAAAPLLATADDGARAYIAIEPPAARWPPLKAGSPATAGPFYLVWLRPERARIAPEQWPYQIARIEDVAPLTVRFPVLLPAASVSTHGSDPARPDRVHDQLHRLPYAQPGGGREGRTGPQRAVQPDRLHARGIPAPADPRPEFAASLARQQDAGVRHRGDFRPRSRRPGCLPVLHGQAEGGRSCTEAIKSFGLTGTLIEGEMVLMIDGQPDRTVKAGESYQIPAGIVHDVRTLSGPAKGVAVYMVPKGMALAAAVQ